jgi:IS30 family transposase
MQVFGLHKSIYKLNRFIKPEENFTSETLIKNHAVKTWQQLKARGIPEAEIASITGISRASFYRRLKQIKAYGLKGLERRSRRPKTFRKSQIPKETIDLILQLRHLNPTYGKAKITVLLKRDHGIILSESSVGRVIRKLILEGKITQSISSCKVKRKRRFKAHAKQWKYGMKAQNPGELIQIDHMSVTKHNIHMKEFRAWDPITKVIIADVTCNATSAAATKFLKKVIKEMPFKVKSVQVDGGSEFMKYFENECEKLDIPLYVLPPKRPQWNGGVERANRIFREEFYGRKDLMAESLGAFKVELKHAVHKYNSYRPHFNLNGLTPFEYTAKILAA